MATKKQKQLEEQQRNQSRREIAGLCLFTLGLLFSLGIYTDAVGIVGNLISRIFFSLCGLMGYAIPVVLLAAGVLVIVFSPRQKKSSLTYLYILTFLCILTILHTYVNPDVEAKALVYFSQALSSGMADHSGGGILGALLAYPSIKLFGEAGTYIFYFALLIIIMLLITRISLRSAGEKVGKAIKSGVDGAKEQIGQHQKQRRGSAVEESGDDLFTQDLMRELMEVPSRSPKKRRQPDAARRTRAARPAARDGFFPLDDALVSEKDSAQIPIREMNKVRYAQDDLTVLPMSGIIERKPASKLEQDIEDVVSAIQSAPVTPLPGSERLSRISEHAPHNIQAPAKAETVPAAAAIQPVEMQIADQTLPYQFPPVSLLKQPRRARGAADNSEAMGRLLIETLASFNIQARILNISIGPVITRFELQPAQGVRVSRITALSNDIALALAAPRVRIEAPIPGKAAVGIEIPNKDVAGVFLRELVETPEFRAAASPITFALGKDIAGKLILADLEKMPHLLIAGSTGSGKSVCINNIILSLAYQSAPCDVRMILIDPKVVELKVFASLPHLYLPVVTEPKRAASALKWAVMEMEQRYRRMSQCNARDIARYNALQNDPDARMPLLVIVIDELADLMMVSAKDVEESICRIAQLGRACGIHLIVATQRPSADIITGLIKANIASRIAFMVSSAVDSRVILDCNGAEKLLGRGDMLFHPNGSGKPLRVQGAFVSDEEVERIMDFFASRSMTPAFKENNYTEVVAAAAGPAQGNGKQEDDLLGEAVRIVLESGQASISMIQRRLRVGYARAARLIDIMEQHKIVSGFDGSKPRKLLISSFAEYEQLCTQSGEGIRDP